MPNGYATAPYAPPRRPIWPWVVGSAAAVAVVGGVIFYSRSVMAKPVTMPSDNGGNMQPTLAQEGEISVGPVAATFQVFYDPETSTWWHEWKSTPLSRMQANGSQSGFQSINAAVADVEAQVTAAGQGV